MKTKNVAGLDENRMHVVRLSVRIRVGWRASLPVGVENHSSNPAPPLAVPWSRKRARAIAEQAEG